MITGIFKDEKDIVNRSTHCERWPGVCKTWTIIDTLSGGEPNVVKLASFLGKGKAQGHILFIFVTYHRPAFS